MIPILVLLLGSAASTLQETTARTKETYPTTFTTARLSDTDETSPTFQTTINLPETTFPRQAPKLRNNPSCKNQFLCVLQRKSTLSKGFPPVPSKNLVPPFTDSEEEELKTTEAPRTTLNEAETESAFPTTLISRATSVRSVKIPPLVLQKRNNFEGEKARPEASNELRSYLPPASLAPSAAQVDLSYLPPAGVLPAAAAASLDIARVNYLPPEEVKPAAAQTDFAQVKPDLPRKDVCSDAFHSFLCTPLKSRKRITGALPNGPVPNPAASNTVQNAIGTVVPTVSTPARQTTFSNEPTTPPRTTPAYAPQPSNVDRSYLPPAPKSFDASPSFNSVQVAKANEKPTTTRKPFSTSTPRPFFQTSIIPFISPKVIEQIKHTTERPKTTTPTPRLSPEPSNDVNRNYLPPVVVKAAALPTFRQRTPSVQVASERPKTTTPTPRLSPEPSNDVNRNYLPPVVVKAAALPTFRQRTPSVQIVTETTKAFVTTPAPKSYLPPSPKIEPAAAVQINQAVAPANRIAVPHHDHHDHHHGKDICSDPFHSFLCAPLKQRKRITGALPPGFNPQSSNRKETKVRPETPPKPASTLQSERRTKPIEEVPAANVLSPQTVGYQYPKPSPSPSNADIIPKEAKLSTSATSFPGYQYPKPKVPFLLPSESKQNPSPLPSPSAPSPSLKPQPSDVKVGYQYPKPTVPFLLPSESSSRPIPSPSAPVAQSTNQKVGYQYPKPSTPFLLPSESSSRPIPSPPTPAAQSTDQRVGYQYPKPSTPFLLPSESPSRPIPSPSAPVAQSTNQKVGYQYPKPSTPFLLPSESSSRPIPSPPTPAAQSTDQRVGYQYPKPSTPFLLPSESRQNEPLSSAKPLQPQPSDKSAGYQYPKPAQQLPLPSGYRYPKPANQLVLPTEVKSSGTPALNPSSRDLGSAEFIPVNKIDAKRQVRTGLAGGSPRFGERIKHRVRQSNISS